MLIILTSHPIQYQIPLWRSLASAGIQLEVWYLCDQGLHERRDVEFGKSFAWDLPMLEGYSYRFLDIPNWNLRRPLTMRLRQSLLPLFRQVGATTLWVEGWRFPAFWQAVFQANRVGMKIWCRGESNDLSPQPPFPKRWIKKLLLGWLFQRVDTFLCIGSANRRLYLRYRVPSSKLADAPYSVDNARFRNEAFSLRPTRDALRANWGIPSDAFCVLFAGKFIRKKRPLDIIFAINLLISRRPAERRFHILFVGSGELGATMRSNCSVVYDKDGEQRTVKSPTPSADDAPPASFAGFLNQREICRAYVVADCLVLPSDAGETWGLVVNEAMACGLPCIVSDACGCAEDLAAPVHPMLHYPCGDVGSLGAALLCTAARSISTDAIKQVIDRHDMTWTLHTAEKLLAEQEIPVTP